LKNQLLLIFCFCCGFIQAQIYYIDTSGVDDVARDGLSEATAWATLSFATSQANGPSDTIQFGEGAFVETQTSYPNAGVTILGVDTSLTKVYADTSWEVSSTMKDEIETDYMIYLGQKDGVTIRDIHFTSLDTSVMPNGVLYAFLSDSITVDQVFIEDFRWAGLRYYINNNCEIANSHFKNCSQFRDGAWSGHIRTRYFNYSTIHHNLIESTWGSGYGYKASGHRDTKFHDNVVDVKGSFSIESAHENEYEFEIYNNQMTGTISVPKGGQQANPLLSGWDYSIWIHDNYLEDSYTVEGPRNHMTISHNHIDIQHTGGRVYTCFGGVNSGPVYIHNNVVENISRSLVWKNNGNIDSIHIFNNTIYAAETDIAGALVDLGNYNNGRSAYGWTFRNNVVVAPASQRRNLHWPSAQQAENLTVEHNMFINVDLVPETGANHVEIMPDFKLTGDKPSPYFTANCLSGNTVDQGIEVGYPFLGSAPDLGALEYDPMLEARLPFDTIANKAPFTLEIEHYDIGGESVAYHDDNLKEGDPSFRPEDMVDVCANTNASNGFAVCHIEEGEWLEYTFEVEQGIYDVVLKHSSVSVPSGTVVITLDADTIVIFDNLTSTGGHQTFGESRISDVILSGRECAFLRLSMTGDVGYLDNLTFDRIGDIPVLGVSILNCPEVDLIETVDYQFEYETIPFDAANQVVTWTTSDPLIVSIDSNGRADVLNNEGGAMIYVTTVEGQLVDSCYVQIDTSGQTPYNFVPQYIPGHIEAEHYDEGGNGIAFNDDSDVDRDCHDRNDDVDTQECEDLNGGCNTGWSNDGEWLEYTTINTPGLYKVKARMASNNNTGRISFSIDGEVLCTLDAPGESDGWQDWHTAEASSIPIPGGKHTLRVFLDEGGFNLNWLEFEYEEPCTCADNDQTCTRSATEVENRNIYIGPKVGNWMDSPCNWSKGCLPTVCDDVIIQSGTEVTIGASDSVSAYKLIIESGATVNLLDGGSINVEVE